MKLSDLYHVADTLEALRVGDDRLVVVQHVRAGASGVSYGELEIMIGERKMLEGVYGEPHDEARFDELKASVLKLVEEYLLYSTAATKRELTKSGVEINA